VLVASRELSKHFAIVLRSPSYPIQIYQPKRLLDLPDGRSDVNNKRATTLGIAFPGIDDIRSSRSIPLTDSLEEQSADVVDCDTVVAESMYDQFPKIKYTDSAADALADAAACLVTTDWDEFTALNEAFESIARKLVIDSWRVNLPIGEHRIKYEASVNPRVQIS